MSYDEDIVDKFVADLDESYYGRQKKTSAKQLTDWLDLNALTLRDVRTEHLNRFMSETAGAMTVHKQKVVASSVREIFRIVYDGAPLNANPAARWKYAPIGEVNHRVSYRFSAEELRALFDDGNRIAAATGDIHERVRLYKLVAVAELTYATGMGPRDLCGLQMQSLATHADGYITIGEGADERMVPITPRAYFAVTSWRQEAAKLCSRPSDHVFYNEGTGGISIDAQSIRDQLVKLSQSLRGRGAEFLSFSSLQSAFAVHLLQRGAKPELLSYVLGHKRLTAMKSHIKNAALPAGAVSKDL